jgi:Holliday junction resolvase RusA-like endonuclease
MEPYLELFVPGAPATAGSMKGIWNPKAKCKDGRPGKVILIQDHERSMPWMTNVQGHAMQAMAGKARIETGPVLLWIDFHLVRPKSQFRTGAHEGELRTDVPQFSTSHTRGDLTKLTRCVEDGMTGIVWTDDSQVAVQNTSKVYCDPGEVPGANIKVFLLK